MPIPIKYLSQQLDIVATKGNATLEDGLEKGVERSFCERYVEKIQDKRPRNSEENVPLRTLGGKEHSG